MDRRSEGLTKRAVVCSLNNNLRIGYCIVQFADADPLSGKFANRLSQVQTVDIIAILRHVPRPFRQYDHGLRKLSSGLPRADVFHVTVSDSRTAASRLTDCISLALTGRYSFVDHLVTCTCMWDALYRGDLDCGDKSCSDGQIHRHTIVNC